MPTQVSITNTTATALGSAGAADVVIWAFQCIEKHSLITPDQPTAMVIAAFLVPIGHALVRGIGNLFAAKKEVPANA